MRQITEVVRCASQFRKLLRNSVSSLCVEIPGLPYNSLRLYRIGLMRANRPDTYRFSKSLVFHLFSRLFVVITACVLIVPVFYLPGYKDRITAIICGQGETFASTLLAVNEEALYYEDYASLLEYVQSALTNTPHIERVQIINQKDQVITIGSETWSLDGLEQVSEVFSRTSEDRKVVLLEDETGEYFYFHEPIEIGNYPWGHLQMKISAHEYNQLLAEYYRNYLLVAVSMILSVLMLMFFTSRPIVRQLESLRESADLLAGGKLDTQVPEHSIGELKLLSRSFNAMAQSLNEKTKRISQLAKVVEETNEGFAIFDAAEEIVFCNRTVEELLNKITDVRPESLSEMLELLGVHNSTTVMNRARDARIRTIDEDREVHVEIKLQRISGNHGESHHFVLAVADITQRKVLEERLKNIAHYDKLTGLPNRRMFLKDLDDALAVREPKMVVLFMDLDNFKVINDSLGHEAGDFVLRTVAERLGSCLRSEDLLARLGGDEFTAIIRSDLSHDGVRNLMQRIIHSIDEPLQHEGRDLKVGISVGAVQVPEDAHTASDILKKADIAMYHSKQQGKRSFSFFDDSMLQALIERLDTEEALRRALREDELEMFYQPIFHADGTLFGCEALLRWPAMGLTPDIFVAVAERSDLIVDLDRWVLRTVIQQVAEWSGLLDGRIVSINVSGRVLKSQNLSAWIKTDTQAFGVDPQRLQIEVTESVFIEGEDQAAGTLEAIRDLGCRVAIDDFGSGYSSFGYLYKFPIDTLKLDRSFMAQCPDSDVASAVIRSILKMADELGMVSIAEGVESERQAEWLIRAGCKALQGFLYEQALPAEQMRSRFNHALIDQSNVLEFAHPS